MDGFVQERRNFSALALELCLSSINTSICSTRSENQDFDKSVLHFMIYAFVTAFLYIWVRMGMVKLYFH